MLFSKINNDDHHGPTTQADHSRQYKRAPRGAYSGRGGRGGGSRQAAVETEHMVVRGSNKGKHITTTVVYHGDEQPESYLMADLDYTLMGDPPDVAKIFVNLVEPPDEAMEDSDNYSGLNGHVAHSQLRT